jgi:lysozyme
MVDKNLRDILIYHEGLSLKLYKCPAGYFSIGYGRNIEANGISAEEAEFMLSNDIAKAYKDANTFGWFSALSEARKVVVLSMLFNLGKPKFSTFNKMLNALEAKDYARAASEMLLSQWASQVGKRAVNLAAIMKTGVIV